MRGRIAAALGIVSVVLSAALVPGVAGAAHRPAAGSDSAFHALSRRPVSTLSADELAWLGVQRQWRANREAPAGGRVTGISQFEAGPQSTVEEARYQSLVSRSYESLADSDRAWLVGAGAEIAARRPARSGSSGHALVGGLLLGSVVGLLVGSYAVASAYAHAWATF